MYDDMKTVSGSITVLFVALVFVYLVFFSVHGKELQPYPSLEELAASGSLNS
ncbi:MAG: hypothetical protein H6765_06745 [Candidatus Peribacteria bacterium]|nr:MAG: hypothetical protein H6765_06745 [Candidatus Peribacteria bacterium]